MRRETSTLFPLRSNVWSSHFGNPFSATGLGPRYTRKIAETEFIAGSSSVWKMEQKSLPSVTTLMELCFGGTVCNNQGEEGALCGCLPPIGFLQQLYLHGLHHKLSWSSPNKARHFFGVFASVSRRGRHKHTHRDNKTKKRKKRKWTRHCTDKNMWPGLRFRLATLGYSPSLRPSHQASDPPSPNLPV